MDDNRQTCETCSHYREFAPTPGSQAESAWCMRDGEDTDADGWCELYHRKWWKKERKE